jgi:hypothetical protein
VRQNLPPGFSTRKISAAIARGLETCSIHSQLITQSKLLSGNFKDWASPTKNWTDAEAAEVRRFAISMAFAEKSIPVTRTFGAVLASQWANSPRPQPTRGPHLLSRFRTLQLPTRTTKPKGVATACTHVHATRHIPRPHHGSQLANPWSCGKLPPNAGSREQIPVSTTDRRNAL